MKKVILIISMISLEFLYGCKNKETDQVQTMMIDGVKYILNPEIPLKGTVTLEIQKIREIDPYLREEVGIKILRFERDS